MSRLSAIVENVDDTQVEIVPITAWKIEVEVRGMSLVERQNYLTALFKARAEEDQETLNRLDAEIVVECTYDPEDGSKVFTEAHIPMLMGKSAAVVAILSFKAQKLSGLDANAEERLGKDFSPLGTTASPVVATIPSAVATSDSPENSD